MCRIKAEQLPEITKMPERKLRVTTRNCLFKSSATMLSSHNASWKLHPFSLNQGGGEGAGMSPVCVGSFLMGEKKHINTIPPKVPGQSREKNLVYVFFSLCVFSLPMKEPKPKLSWRTFRIYFYFFLLGGGEGRVRSAGTGGGRLLLKIPGGGGGGGLPSGWGKWGRGAGRVFAESLGGGGAKYIFFRGRNARQKTVFLGT